MTKKIVVSHKTQKNNTQKDKKVARQGCRFCSNKISYIDYKDADRLNRFLSDRGKILPRRLTKCCAKHQRQLAKAVKRARIAGLLPFVVK